VDDATDLFYALTGHPNESGYREFLTAPECLRSGLVSLIRSEASEAREGRAAHIIIKINSLTDPEVIREFYDASRAGVRIDLLVRGICSLRPGVTGVSESITVRSTVSRFLEHSRLFWFQNGGEPRVFIGSADIMERSFDRRVEVLCPVHDPDLRDHLRNVVLETMLRDGRRTRTLQSDGSYVAAAQADDDAATIDAQELLTQSYAAAEKAPPRDLA
jgi:polyphosphate kinase